MGDRLDAPVLVTGATGNIGSLVVRELLGAGRPVRAFVRDAAALGARLGTAELVEGDLADAGAVRRALDGAGSVFLSTGDAPGKVGIESRVIEVAAETGGRIVKLSTVGAAADARPSFWAQHGQVEERLAASGLPHVVLRSSFYMSNVLSAAASVAATGAIVAPMGGARIAMVHPRDVAAAAAALLTDGSDDADGAVLTVTGPEAITYEDVASALAAAIGGPVAFVDVPEEAARQGLRDSGAPEWFSEGLLTVAAELRAGAAADVTSTVEELTGVPPRTFAEFAREAAPAFREGSVVGAG